MLRSISEGGKRSVFLTNTQALARQQAEVIGKMTSLNVRVYTGDMDVDNWNREKWTNEFESAQVKSKCSQQLYSLQHNDHQMVLRKFSFQNDNATGDHCNGANRVGCCTPWLHENLRFQFDDIR